VLVTDKTSCQGAITRLKKEKLIAVDCEWTGIGREAKLAVIQVATGNESMKPKVFIFDIVTGGPALFQYGLKELLESKDITKVLFLTLLSTFLFLYCKDIS